jgi:hypothetical protein
MKNEIIYWHRRYYGPLSIAALVGRECHEVQAVIYEYEIRMRGHRL